MCIIEFSASAALARIARLDADPRVFAALAAAYDNDYSKVLAGRITDDIVYVTKAYNRYSLTFRFCNFDVNVAAAVNQGYLGIVNRLIPVAQWDHKMLASIFKTKRPEAINHPLMNNFSLQMRLRAAIECNDFDYIDEHYDQACMTEDDLASIIISAGVKCAMKHEEHIPDGYLYMYFCQLIKLGEFDRCAALLKRMPEDELNMARCNLMAATGYCTGLDEVATAMLKPGTARWWHVEPLAAAAARAKRIDIIRQMFEHREYRVEEIIGMCVKHLDDDLCCDVIASAPDGDDALKIVCAEALKQCRFALFDKHWHDRFATSPICSASGIVHIGQLSMSALVYVVKRFGIYNVTPAVMCECIADCEDAADRKYVLDQIDDDTIAIQAFKNETIAKYAVERRVKVPASAVEMHVTHYTCPGILYMPHILTDFTFTLLYRYCSAIGNLDMFVKIASSAGPHPIVLDGCELLCRPDDMCDLIVVLMSAGDVKRLEHVIQLMRECDMASVEIDVVPKKYDDVHSLILESSDVITVTPQYEDY